MDGLFLDSNAHMPLNKEALKALISFNNSVAGHGHPSSPSFTGREAALALEEARVTIATILGAKSSGNIIFTSGATQACEWAISILKAIDSGFVYTSPTEHPAVRNAVHKYFPGASEIPINKYGEITKFNFNGTAICIHLQNEIGIIQKIEDIKAKYLFTDMSQSAGKRIFNLEGMKNVDLAAFGGHKFGGPVGVGMLYLKDTSMWKEFGTGSRYFMDRAGTLDVGSIVATAAALEACYSNFYERMENMVNFRDIVEEGLIDMGLDIVGYAAQDRSPSTTFVNMGEQNGLMTLIKLGEVGIQIGLGSACGSAATGPSYLMQKMRVGGNTSAHNFMRISNFGYYGKKEAKLFLDQFRVVTKGMSFNQ